MEDGKTMQDKLRAMRRRRHFISAGLAFGLLGTWTATSAWAAEPGPLLVLGDSLSAEYGLARGTGWVALLQKRLQESPKNVPLVNASVSGETTSGGRSRLPALLKKHKPSVVVI
jgi:acyl-CoA thioesterase-1